MLSTLFSIILKIPNFIPMKRIRRIVRSFRPSKPVLVIEVNKADYYMAVSNYFLLAILFVDKSCRKMPTPAVKALVLHELIHLEDPTLSERGVDLRVIQLGFKEHLISFHRWHNKKFKKYKRKDGLTLDEILHE